MLLLFLLLFLSAGPGSVRPAAGLTAPAATQLAPWLTSLQNLPSSWVSGTDPCSAGWTGVSCSGGYVVYISVSISNNNNGYLSGTIPTSLSSLSTLTYLYLSVNYISGTIPTQLGQLTRVTCLYFWNNALTGTIPSELMRLSSATTIDLS